MITRITGSITRRVCTKEDFAMAVTLFTLIGVGTFSRWLMRLIDFLDSA